MEMNMHLPQTVNSEIELRNLSTVTQLLVSSEDSAPFVGIYQDALVGAYRMTRDDVNITKKEFMHLMMFHDKFDGILPEPSGKDEFGNPLWKGRDLVSKILPPKLSIYRENKPLPGMASNEKNDKIVIENGVLKSGQLSKGLISGAGGALHHIIYLDQTPDDARDFIDRITRITNNWLLQTGFSIGAKDMISSKGAKEEVRTLIEEAFSKINEKTRLVSSGLLDAQLGKTVREQFEQEVIQILQSVGMESIKKVLPEISNDNAIINMVNAGSKGKPENIQQIMCALGQQSLNGGRIPENYRDRCLPHFQKYDLSPASHGFIVNNFINGMEPTEFFFSQCAGREGVIDTAIKTASTGYTQRKLMKGLEDAKIHYDNTVRNINEHIIQFLYGDDGLDPRFIEKQKLNIYGFSDEMMQKKYKLSDAELKSVLTTDAFKKYQKEEKKMLDEEYQTLTTLRSELRYKYLKKKATEDVALPVNIKRLITTTINRFELSKLKKVDMTPKYVYDKIADLCQKLPIAYRLKKTDINEVEMNACYLMTALIRTHLSVKQVIVEYNLTKDALDFICDTIYRKFIMSIAPAGFMAGPVAAQSIGHPITQATLNTFHLAGVASASKKTRGIGRITELLSLSKKIKTEITTLYLTPEYESNREKAIKIGANIEHCLLNELVSKSDIYFDPNDKKTVVKSDEQFIKDYYKYSMDDETMEGLSNWVIRFTIDKESLIYEQIRMREIKKRLQDYNKNMHIIYTDDNAKELVIRIRVNPVKLMEKQNDEFNAIREYESELLENVVIKGIENIKDAEIVPHKDTVFNEKGELVTNNNWKILTNGCNLMKVYGVNGIDYSRSTSNNIHEIFEVLGIEAARNILLEQFIENNIETNYHHLSLLIDSMTYRGYLMSIDRHGINRSDIGPIARASFEETTEQLVNASMWAEMDNLNGVSANVLLGRMHKGGTGAFDVYLNEKMLGNAKELDEDIESKFD